MTERQDIVLNMTKMSDKEVMDETTTWLARLNKKFGNLDKENLIKTGGYSAHSKNQGVDSMDKVKKTIVDNRMLKIIEENEKSETVINYAAQTGTMN